MGDFLLALLPVVPAMALVAWQLVIIHRQRRRITSLQAQLDSWQRFWQAHSTPGTPGGSAV